MASTSFRVEIDESALKNAVKNASGASSVLNQKANEIAERANAMGAGFRTCRFYDRKEHKLKGNTQPVYGAVPAMRTSNGWIALVHNENYAGYRDTLLHNTLLKAGGQ